MTLLLLTIIGISNWRGNDPLLASSIDDMILMMILLWSIDIEEMTRPYY